MVARGVPQSGRGVSLVERYVAHIVEAIFDGPAIARQIERFPR